MENRSADAHSSPQPTHNDNLGKVPTRPRAPTNRAPARSHVTRHTPRSRSRGGGRRTGRQPIADPGGGDVVGSNPVAEPESDDGGVRLKLADDAPVVAAGLENRSSLRRFP